MAKAHRIRPANESDLPLINGVLRHVDKTHQKMGPSDVWVVCDSEDSNTLFGFLWAPRRSAVGYIFIKEAFRQFGLARDLVAHVFLGETVPALTSVPMSRKTAIALKHLGIKPASPLSWETLIQNQD